MEDKILARILGKAGSPDILDILSDRISPTDLQSLLLEVFSRRARRIPAPRLLEAYASSRFVKPSEIDPRLFGALDALAFSLLPPDTNPIELSPVAPLGSCAVLGGLDQKRLISTVRNTEVVADATTVMALECALRRRLLLQKNPRSRSRVKLYSSHRLIRGQSFEDPKFSAHFRNICLATAGRDEGGFLFEVDSAREHLDFHLKLLARVIQASDVDFGIELLLTDLAGRDPGWAESSLVPFLAERHPAVRICFDPRRKSGKAYYKELCFRIRLTGGDGAAYDYLMDGGFTDWTGRILSNGKEKFLTSGLGPDYLIRIIGPDKFLSRPAAR